MPQKLLAFSPTPNPIQAAQHLPFPIPSPTPSICFMHAHCLCPSPILPQLSDAGAAGSWPVSSLDDAEVGEFRGTKPGPPVSRGWGTRPSVTNDSQKRKETGRTLTPLRTPALWDPPLTLDAPGGSKLMSIGRWSRA